MIKTYSQPKLLPGLLKKWRQILWIIIIFQSVFFSYQMRAEKIQKYDDTFEYENLAHKIQTQPLHLIPTTIKNHNRPPAYPLLLVLSDKIGIAPHLLTSAINPFGAAIFLLLPASFNLPLQLTLSSAYLWINASSMLLSYQKTKLTESILPFFLALIISFSFFAKHALERKNIRAWILIICLQIFFSLSLKPSFKGLVFFEILIALTLVNKIKLKKIIPAIVFVLSFWIFVNHVLFSGSGMAAIHCNKTIFVNNQPLPNLPDLDDTKNDSELAEIKILHEKATRCGPILRRNERDPSCMLEYKDGSRLYDYLATHYPFSFFRPSFERLFKILKYASWGEDYGHLENRIGISSGYGFKGLILAAFLFSIILTLVNATAYNAFLNLLCHTSYHAFILLVAVASDVGRLSLSFLISFYFFSILFFSWLISKFLDKTRCHIKKIKV